MQPDSERKKAMMDELKHYINGKIAELEEKLLTKLNVGMKAKPEQAAPKKVDREKAVRG
jgi:hypothetical protein